MPHQLVAVERAQHHFLMIAKQDAHPPLAAPSARGGNYPGAVGAAVDQVAQQHHTGLRRAARSVVGFDLGDQRLEQIKSAVDIANRIDPLPSRNGSNEAAGSRAEQGAKAVEHAVGGSACAYTGPKMNEQLLVR
jgi:hypothetical protein